MECFGMQDGRNFPYMDIYGPGKNPQGIDIFADRDPRLYETIVVPRKSQPAGFDYAGMTYMDSWVGGFLDKNSNVSNKDDVASGYCKFKWLLDYYGGSRYDDDLIGVPYIRLAEMYLIRAEAKAETATSGRSRRPSCRAQSRRPGTSGADESRLEPHHQQGQPHQRNPA